MKFSLRLNNDLPFEELSELAVTAEAAGFDQLWVSHDLLLRSAPVLLGALAMRTTTLELGIGIVNPYSIHPAELAMMAASLQEVSDGRFRLGLSAGAAEFLGWVGLERPLPLTRTREALRAIRALVEGGRPADVEGAGTGWSDHARLRTPPTQVPIHVGAMSPKMLALAGAEAEGVLPLLFPPEHFPVARDHVVAGAEAVGRDPDEVDIAACVWASVDDDGDRADRALAEKLAYYGPSFSTYLLSRAGIDLADFDPVTAALERGDVDDAVAHVTPAMLRLGISGTAADVLHRCELLVDQGARHISFGPPLGPDPIAAVQHLGSGVMDPLRTCHASVPGSR